MRTANRQIDLRQMLLCALFAALMAAGAFIKIPTPLMPITLQTMFATLAGMILGPRLGTLSVLLYIAIGLIGVPVFTLGGSISYIWQPTFGYILGFIPCAYLAGMLTARTGACSVKGLFAASLPGLFAVYAVGLPYFYGIMTLNNGKTVSMHTLFISCFLIFVPGDALTCLVAAILTKRLRPIVSKMSIPG